MNKFVKATYHGIESLEHVDSQENLMFRKHQYDGCLKRGDAKCQG